MKKLLSLLLSSLMILSLCACGGSNSGSSEVTPPKDVSSAAGDTASEESSDNQDDVTISETVLLDESGVKVTAKSLNMDGAFGPEIKVLIENNSGQPLTFQCENSSVNGYMIENSLSADVMDGKKANDGISFDSSSLENCGISTITDVEFSFHIFNTDTWDDYLKTDAIQIKTSAADTYNQEYDDSGETVYDSNGIKIVAKGLSEDMFGQCIVLYIENNSDENITVQAENTSVNGFMIEPFQSTDVLSGKRAVDTLSFMNEELEENEITDIETVEVSFNIADANSWDSIVHTDAVTLTF